MLRTMDVLLPTLHPAKRLEVALLKGLSLCSEEQCLLHLKESSYQSRSNQAPKDWTDMQGTISYYRTLKWQCIFSDLLNSFNMVAFSFIVCMRIR